MREYGRVKVEASVTIAFDREPDDDTVKDTVCTALSDYGDVDIVSYEREPWDEAYENEADVAVLISADAVREYQAPSWDDNTGGDPGYDETDFELSESDVKSALQKNGLNVSCVLLSTPEMEAA